MNGNDLARVKVAAVEAATTELNAAAGTPLKDVGRRAENARHVPREYPREPAAQPGAGGPQRTPPPDPFEGRFVWLAEDALLTRPPPRRYLLKSGAAGVLPLGKAGMLVAAGGAGKTLALCQLAVAVALGGSWLECFDVAESGPVLLALGEEDEEEVRRRLHSVADSMALSREERALAARRIVVLPMAGVNVALTSGDGRGNVEPTHVRDYLKYHLECLDVDWRLVVLDPLSRWAGNDVEKDSHAATRFVEVAEELTSARGTPTVLIAHHSNKLARRADVASGAEAARGASALTDGVRWVANLDADGPHVAVLRITKNNYGPPTDPVYLVRDAEHGGALRRMSESELEELEAQRAERARRAPRAGRPPVDELELDDRIVAAIAKAGPQPSKRAIKRLGSLGKGARVDERIDALLETGRLIRTGAGVAASETEANKGSEHT